MVSAGLRELLERGDGVGDIDGPDVVTGSAEHPICGDRMQLSLHVVDDVVKEARWRAAGCPASMALAALCAKELVDVQAADVAAVMKRAIASHGGLERHERHAEAMVLRALQAALGG